MSSYTSSVSAGLITTSLISSSLTGNLASVWAVVNTIQVLAFIPMCELNLPLPLSAFFTSLLNFNLIPNVFGYFVPDEASVSFSRAEAVGINSSVFLLNGGELITTFVLGLLLWPLSLFLLRVKAAKIGDFFRKMAEDFQWSYFIRFCFESQLELTIAALLQMPKLSASSISLIMNSILASLVLVRPMQLFSCVLPLATGAFLVFNRNRLSSHEETPFRRRFGSFFDEFRDANGPFSKSYYFWFSLRRLAYIAILLCLSDYPVLQVSLNVLHSILSSAFAIYCTPYDSSPINLSYIVSEVGLAVVFLETGLFLCSLPDAYRLVLKWTTLGTVLAIITVGLAISSYLQYLVLAKFYIKLKEFCKTQRRVVLTPEELRNNQSSITSSGEPSIIFEANSPDFKATKVLT
jgi:hypothetical protein